MIEVQEKIFDKKNEKNDKDNLEDTISFFFNNAGAIEYLVNLVLVLHKGKKIVMNLFEELRKSRIFVFFISRHEKILFEKVFILYKEQILRDREKIEKNLSEGKDINYLYLNDNENSNDNNDEEPDQDT